MDLTESVIHLVKVTHIVDIDNFSAHIGDESSFSMLKEFEQRLSQYAAANEDSDDSAPELNGNDLVLVRCGENKWRRAVINFVARSNDEVDVLFVDHGGTEFVSPDQILTSLPDWAREMPQLSWTCRLFGVQPVDGGRWSEAAVRRFSFLVEGQTHNCHLISMDGAGPPMCCVLDILTENENMEITSVSEILIEEGLAKRKDIDSPTATEVPESPIAQFDLSRFKKPQSPQTGPQTPDFERELLTGAVNHQDSSYGYSDLTIGSSINTNDKQSSVFTQIHDQMKLIREQWKKEENKPQEFWNQTRQKGRRQEQPRPSRSASSHNASPARSPSHGPSTLKAAGRGIRSKKQMFRKSGARDSNSVSQIPDTRPTLNMSTISRTVNRHLSSVHAEAKASSDTSRSREVQRPEYPARQGERPTEVLSNSRAIRQEKSEGMSATKSIKSVKNEGLSISRSSSSDKSDMSTSRNSKGSEGVSNKSEKTETMPTSRTVRRRSSELATSIHQLVNRVSGREQSLDSATAQLYSLINSGDSGVHSSVLLTLCQLGVDHFDLHSSTVITLISKLLVEYNLSSQLSEVLWRHQALYFKVGLSAESAQLTHYCAFITALYHHSQAWTDSGFVVSFIINSLEKWGSLNVKSSSVVSLHARCLSLLLRDGSFSDLLPSTVTDLLSDLKAKVLDTSLPIETRQNLVDILEWRSRQEAPSESQREAHREGHHERRVGRRRVAERRDSATQTRQTTPHKSVGVQVSTSSVAPSPSDPYARIKMMLDSLNLNDLLAVFTENVVRDSLLDLGWDDLKSLLIECGLKRGHLMEIKLYLERAAQANKQRIPVPQAVSQSRLSPQSPAFNTAAHTVVTGSHIRPSIEARSRTPPSRNPNEQCLSPPPGFNPLPSRSTLSPTARPFQPPASPQLALMTPQVFSVDNDPRNAVNGSVISEGGGSEGERMTSTPVHSPDQHTYHTQHTPIDDRTHYADMTASRRRSPATSPPATSPPVARGVVGKTWNRGDVTYTSSESPHPHGSYFPPLGDASSGHHGAFSSTCPSCGTSHQPTERCPHHTSRSFTDN